MHVCFAIKSWNHQKDEQQKTHSTGYETTDFGHFALSRLNFISSSDVPNLRALQFVDHKLFKFEICRFTCDANTFCDSAMISLCNEPLMVREFKPL